ncbi:MAG: type VI secretion system baseplate subunit TssG [Alphaproteobacteria bacterium]|nr:type VI secretion system baseplate subunit TssG [Alphaproteobacteria bacterium]
MSWLKSIFKKYRKQAIQPKKKKPIIDLLIFEPYKFSLVKAIDVLKLHSDILIIKSNLHFSSKYSTVYKVEGVRDGYVELYTNFVSIIGIDGSLPDAYVEKYALYNIYTKDAIRDFFDIFHSGCVNAYYKISKQYNPACSNNITYKSLIGKILLQLSGYNSAEEFYKAINYTDIPLQLPISAHNLFWNENRSAYGLQLLLSNFFEINVKVEEFYPKLIELPVEEQTRIGNENRKYNKLGISTILDRFIWDTTSKISVIVGPLPLDKYIQFLPKRSKDDRRFSLLQKIEELVRLYIPFDIEVLLKIMLAKSIVNGTILNRSKALNKDAFIFGKTNNVYFIKEI